MDHLLLHRYGVIVESKSVTDPGGGERAREWCRNLRSQRHGMSSPVEQARGQGEFLRAYLQEHREQLWDKYLLGMKQGGFRNTPVDVLVAISDDGIIRRPRRLELTEVLKADQVSARVHDLLKEYRRTNSLFNLNPNEGGIEFCPDELERIASFLLKYHRQLRRRDQSVQMMEFTPLRVAGSLRVRVSDHGSLNGTQRSHSARPGR